MREIWKPIGGFRGPEAVREVKAWKYGEEARVPFVDAQ